MFVFKVYMKYLPHMRGITKSADLAFLPLTPEMRILWTEFTRQTGYGPEREADYIEKFYEWYNKIEDKRKTFVDSIHSGKDVYRDEGLHPRLRRKIESIEDGRFIIEFGCGTGETVLPYLKPNQWYIGIDTSRFSLEYASQTYGIPIAADTEQEEIPKKYLQFGALPDAIPLPLVKWFDEAVASMVLHHVADCNASIRSMMRLLLPGANYFIATFNSDARPEIDELFGVVKQRDETKTVGDFNLPQGKLPDETIYFHDNQALHNELQKHSDFVHAEECMGILQIFEGIKRNNARK